MSDCLNGTGRTSCTDTDSFVTEISLLLQPIHVTVLHPTFILRLYVDKIQNPTLYSHSHALPQTSPHSRYIYPVNVTITCHRATATPTKTNHTVRTRPKPTYITYAQILRHNIDAHQRPMMRGAR